ncbi:MAG TPA: prepilin-type N-terminal cleavage/methylation domain-containing protein [Rubrivivax sp.]|jgi:general secretion pathway protein J|nr:prepilin-type N-terminal cleavage/methylation domain-containing protein [Rubrivivax sp.]
MKRPVSRHRCAGFTLVEVLIALLLMAILTAMAWQAVDGMLRARDSGRETIDRSARLSTVLTQWEQDLLALHDTEQVPPLSFDGQTLRLTRRSEGGVTLVAWSVRPAPAGQGGVWQRWESPVALTGGAMAETWLRSQQLLGNEPGHVLLAEGASQWQIYFHRGGQWSNPQSTGNLAPQPVAPPQSPASGASAPSAPPPMRELLPDALRLQITLDGHVLTRDIALAPS